MITSTSGKNRHALDLLLLTAVALFVCLAVYRQAPPAAAVADTPLTDFSSHRALKHLGVIARAPREMGSVENRRVRDYIIGELAMEGVNAQVQRATATNAAGSTVYAGTIENVAARLEGSGDGKSVLLVSHYDSVPTSPGASDNGAGVATLLETLRALKAGAPLKKDVILLFTDGEENGLLGAEAFVNQHPWAADVGVVLNFEARGSNGRSIMFETSGGNGRLIEEFAKASSQPEANSLAYEIYKLLPNDTDLTVFKNAGLQGFNFAYLEGFDHFHTRLDTVENIDPASLQHHGTYALSLTRHFANLPEGGEKGADAVYFSILGWTFIHYSSRWVLPLAALVLTLFIAVAVLGLRRKILTSRGILIGLGVCLLSMLTAMVVVSLWRLVLGALDSVYRKTLTGDGYDGGLSLAVMAALTVAVTSALLIWSRKKVGAYDLMMGGLLVWLLLLVVSSLLLPGGSYLFAWPLLSGLVGLGVCFYSNRQERRSTAWHAVLLTTLAVVGVVILVPMIYQIFMAMPETSAVAAVVLGTLLLWLILPHLELLGSRHGWALPGAALLASMALIAASVIVADVNKDNPEAYHLVYALDADTNEAVWATADEQPNKLMAAFFPPDSQRTALPGFFFNSPRTFLTARSAATPQPAPELRLLSESREGDGRTIRLHVGAPPQTYGTLLNVSSAAKICEAVVNGQRVNADARLRDGCSNEWRMRYYALPEEGVELTLKLTTPEPVKVRAVRLVNQLPESPNATLAPATEDLMPAPYLFSNSTLVGKSFTF